MGVVFLCRRRRGPQGLCGAPWRPKMPTVQSKCARQEVQALPIHYPTALPRAAHGFMERRFLTKLVLQEQEPRTVTRVVGSDFCLSKQSGCSIHAFSICPPSSTSVLLSLAFIHTQGGNSSAARHTRSVQLFRPTSPVLTTSADTNGLLSAHSVFHFGVHVNVNDMPYGE